MGKSIEEQIAEAEDERDELAESAEAAGTAGNADEAERLWRRHRDAVKRVNALLRQQ